MEKSCDNCICTHSWNGCGRFDVDTYCDWWKDMFSNGRRVEIRHQDFEFYLKDKPTREYARGVIWKKIDDENFEVELFCNGKIYPIKRDWLKLM